MDRELIAELLLQLEKLNPTEAPATSPLLNGKWKFLYAGGQTPGLLSLVYLLRLAAAAPKSPSGAPLIDVGEAVLTISRNQPRVEASLRVRLLSVENVLKLFTSLEAKTGSVLVEEYKEIESDLFGAQRTRARAGVFGDARAGFLERQWRATRSLSPRRAERAECAVWCRQLGQHSRARRSSPPPAPLPPATPPPRAPAGLKLPLQAPAAFSRSLVVSYLDDDLLIVRSLGGAPDVLVRMEQEWSPPPSGTSTDDGWESVPSD